MDNTADKRDEVKVDLQMKTVDKNQQENSSTMSSTDESSVAYSRKSGLLKTSATVFTVITTVSITVAVLAIILLVILAVINQTAIHSTNNELQSLMSHVTQLAANISEIRAEILTLTREQSRQLQAQINTLSDSYTAVNEQSRQLETQIHTLLDSYTSVNNGLKNGQTSLQELQNIVNLMRSDLEKRLQEEISVLSKEQNITSNDLTMVVEQVGGIESNMKSLKEHVNSSVGLYEGCRTDKVRCTIQPQADQYWRLCSTPYVSEEVEVGCVHISHAMYT